MQAAARSKYASRLGDIVFGIGVMSACAGACSIVLPDYGAFSANGAANGAANAAASDIAALVRRHHAEGLPYAAIRQAGPDALPPLRAMLADPGQRQWWPNVVGAIGIIGGADAASTLIGFVQAQKGRVLDADSYRAALTAVAALGYVAHGDDDAALAFLADAARQVDQLDEPGAGLRLTPSVLGVQAILGLAVSARPQARAELAQLQRSASAATRQRIPEALRIHEQVSRIGLAAYLQR